MRTLHGISETALYVVDMRQSLEFYERVLGLSALHTSDRLSALRIVPGQVLLLIAKGADKEPTVLPFGTLPPSDGQGQLHVAFAIAPDRLPDWRGALAGHGVEIESAIEWPAGGRSLYFRDPDRHCVELKTSDWDGSPVPAPSQPAATASFDDTTHSGFRVAQIDHVELFVPDRYEAAAWYERVLGLTVMHDYEDWAQDSGGPLMISSDHGSTKLALFVGDPRGLDTAGFQLVAFRVPGADFIAFLRRLQHIPVFNAKGDRLTPAAAVDHDKAYSIYFSDPYGHQLEITTYDYDDTTRLLRDAG